MTLLPRDGDGCVQEGSRGAVRGGSFSLGLLCPVLWAEVPKKLLEVMLEIIPGERFWGVFQLFYVNVFSIAVLHHGPLLCAGFTWYCPGTTKKERPDLERPQF